MRSHRYPRALIVFALLGGVLGFELGLLGSPLLGLIAGLAILTSSLLLAAATTREGTDRHDPARRRFLITTTAVGGALAVGGPVLGRTVKQLARPDAQALQEKMATSLGAEYTEIVRRTYRDKRSGELQLILAPFNSANYSNESKDLVRFYPATSHAGVWMYLEAVPLVLHAPGRVPPGSHSERVTLADIAPTAAKLMGFQDFLDLGREGVPLPGVEEPPTPPKVIVTFVFDGGGWNALKTWPGATPNLRRLMDTATTYTNAIHGSFPAVTALAHATIGTGAHPDAHGITGHNIRDDTGTVRKTYGDPGSADPADILIPTLADLWSEATGNRAWVGEIGYQVWHLGMLGRGRPNRGSADKPVGVYWDEDLAVSATAQWQPHNPDLYRLPKGSPSLDVFAGHQADYSAPGFDSLYDPRGHQVDCCSPPIIRYMGDLIEATIANEPMVGANGETGLLFINYKMPDYTGHIYNMLSPMEELALKEVDAQLGRLVAQLDATYGDDYALIVTADHGQCPLPNAVNGVRLDPIQLGDAINREFGGSLWPVVEYVAPSEIFLYRDRLWQSGASIDDIAVFLRDYTYRRNIGPYVPTSRIEHDLLNQLEFSAVFGPRFLASLEGRDLSGYGDTSFPEGVLTGYPDLIDPYASA
ncbi:MAG: alkaline phosphatase family protein [Actinomycetota bacterium]